MKGSSVIINPINTICALLYRVRLIDVVDFPPTLIAIYYSPSTLYPETTIPRWKLSQPALLSSWNFFRPNDFP